MIKESDTVIYKGRKWLVFQIYGRKCHLVLLQGQPPIIRGIEEIRIVSPCVKSVTKIDNGNNKGDK